MMLTFYTHPLACALGVQIALLEADVPHERVFVDLASDRAEYRKINPLGTVPALQTEAGVLTESVAILAWLALTYPQARLLPSEPYGFAHGLSYLSWLSSSVHIARRQSRYPARFTTNAAGHAEVRAVGRQQLELCLQRIDSGLATQRFVLDDQAPSACDHQLMTYAHWCALDGMDIGPWPHFARWRADMLNRPAVRLALSSVDSPLLK